MPEIIFRRFLPVLFAGLFYLGTIAQQTDTLTVHFDYNNAAMTAGAKSIIDNYFTHAEDHFTFQTLQLYGHCDSIGGHPYNDRLSTERNRSVKNYLETKWPKAASAVTTKGFGKRMPLNNNSTAGYRALNRRVEIVLTKIPAATVSSRADTVLTAHQKNSVYDQLTDSATTRGSTIVLHNIVFYGGRHLPMPQSAAVMNELLRAMQTNPLLTIEIDGYVCCEPNEQDGYDYDSNRRDLSVQRSKYIYQFLVDNGIGAGRMRYAGFGGSHKIYPEEKDESEKTMNRRVEIRILGK